MQCRVLQQMTFLVGAIVALLFSNVAKGQVRPYYKIDTGAQVIYRTLCKNYLVFYSAKQPTLSGEQRQSDLKNRFDMHGNVLYDFNYRSLMDTPFAARNFMQHFVQTNLSFNLFNAYPVQVFLTTRRSNSSYFKDYTDVSFRFNQQEFNRSAKEKMQAAMKQKLEEQSRVVGVAYSDWQGKEAALKEVRSSLTNPAQIQKYVEAKEYLSKIEKLRDKAKGLMPADSSAISSREGVANLATQKVRAKMDSTELAKRTVRFQDTLRKRLDSLSSQAESYKRKYVALKKKVEKRADSLQALVKNASVSQLRKIDSTLYDSLSAKEKFLSRIRTLSVGRSPLNYSELSAKNISVNGINFEYNGKYYWAISAGTVQYQFRDILSRVNRYPKQYLGLIRVGKGDIEGNHTILTAYGGNKNTSLFPAANGQQQRIYGLTIENRFQLAPQTSLTVELAKASATTTANGLTKPTFRLGDASTLAASLKAVSIIVKTQTRITATLRYLGANYQSFSLLTNSANQFSWNIGLDQYLLKRMVSIKASVKRNEFENPLIASRYKSSVSFKSFSLSFRKRRLPSFTIGYYPASQLTRMENQFYENQFYSLTATIAHAYRFAGLSCQTILSGSKFSNTAVDTGSFYTPLKNVVLSQTVSGRRLSFVMTATRNTGFGYDLRVLDESLQLSFKNGGSIGAGVKTHTLNNQSSKTGYQLNCVLPLNRFGDISFSYESSFLPSTGKQLISTDVGKITYCKRF